MGWLAVLALAVASASGCSIVTAPYGAVTGPAGFFRDHAAYNDASESLVLGWRNHVWAKKAWYQQRHLFVAHPYVKDYGKGFQAGYNDVANGGSGCVPVLPPREYWSWRYQSPEGQAKSAAWFEGFPVGAAAAEKDGIADWGHIQTGYTADSKSIRGRANYVRIRDEMLKKELKQETEELNVPPPVVPSRTPETPDDLPAPRKTPPPRVEPLPEPKAEPKAEPKTEPKAEPKSEPKAAPKTEAKTDTSSKTKAFESAPILQNPAGDALGSRWHREPIELPPRMLPKLERLPAVEPEISPIQQVSAEIRRLPPTESVAVAPSPEPIAAIAPAPEPVKQPNPFDAPRVAAEAPAVRRPAPIDPVIETPSTPAQRRGVALHSAGELEAPPMMRGSAEETQAEARPALPRMRNLRGQGDAPEAPAPRAGVMVARDTQREEREARAAMTGPILERRSGETSLSDTPSE